MKPARMEGKQMPGHPEKKAVDLYRLDLAQDDWNGIQVVLADMETQTPSP
jgi:hypothetical protein